MVFRVAQLVVRHTLNGYHRRQVIFSPTFIAPFLRYFEHFHFQPELITLGVSLAVLPPGFIWSREQYVILLSF